MDDEDLQGRLFEQLEASLEELRAEALRLAGSGGSDEASLSAAVAATGRLAWEEAQAFDHDYISSEHLLLGVIGGNDEVAHIQVDAGLDADLTRDQIKQMVRAPEECVTQFDRAPAANSLRSF